MIAKRKDAAHDAGLLEIFNQSRALLFSIAYRMLGSVADAEDMLQDTFIRWQQAAHDEIRSPKAFLVTIISRLCINRLQSARAEREEYFGEWLPEPIVTEAQDDPLAIVKVDESLSIAFLLLLERLSPIERAVFLLREVFGYRYLEISGMVRQSEVNRRRLVRRAQQHITAAHRRFERSLHQHRAMVERFLKATRGGDAGDRIDRISVQGLNHSPAHLFGRLFFPTVVVDSAGMENAVRQSHLQWTIVRPPRLTDRPVTKAYRVREGHLPIFGLAISRADVADFTLKTAANGAYIRKIVGISN